MGKERNWRCGFQRLHTYILEKKRMVTSSKVFAVCVVAMVAMAGVATVKAQEEDCLSVAETAVAANFTTLVAAASAAGLVDFLSNKTLANTILAPTDEAFADLLDTLDISAEELLGSGDLLFSVLTYHVIPGIVDTGSPIVTFEGVGSDASVIQADIEACLSVIHVIDSVLLPLELLDPEPEEVDPGFIDDTLAPANVTAPVADECLSVAETAVAANLTILVAAVQAAGLVDELSDKSLEATILAPTDEAFVKLLTDLNTTAEELLASGEVLESVLGYHVIPAVAFSTDLFDGQVLPTSLGENLTVSLADGVTFIGAGSSANVVQADVEACLSVIHVIDEVLLPDAIAPPPPSGPTEVGEGEECQGTVSPEFQTVCAPGLECITPPGVFGAPGICTAVPSCLSIAETAIATPELSSLVAALQAVDLADDLLDKSLSETVLAPNNDAFEELLTALSLNFSDLAAQPELLTAVLVYHALPVGPVFAADLTDGANLPTFNTAANLTVDLSEGVTFAGVGSSASVVTADIEACDSVIHIIDSVLLPEDLLPAAPEPDAPATGGGVAFGPCTVGADCESGVCFGDFETSFFFLFDIFRSCAP